MGIGIRMAIGRVEIIIGVGVEEEVGEEGEDSMMVVGVVAVVEEVVSIMVGGEDSMMVAGAVAVDVVVDHMDGVEEVIRTEITIVRGKKGDDRSIIMRLNQYF